MRKLAWLNHLLVYLLWAIVLAVGIWLLLLSRNALFEVVGVLYVGDSLQRARQLNSLEKFYSLGAGLAWLAMMIVSEFYFRSGARRGRLLERFARVLGVELLLLFVIDAALVLVRGPGSVTWSRWLILGSELVVGVACVLFARRAPSITSDIVYDDEM
ncbi:MAG: hypothetical protein ACP5HS_04725 [Anaerolineae bacterium]